MGVKTLRKVTGQRDASRWSRNHGWIDIKMRVKSNVFDEVIGQWPDFGKSAGKTCHPGNFELMELEKKAKASQSSVLRVQLVCGKAC
jgi:hypothetical protein